MKKSFLTLALIVFTTTTFSQETPEPPQPPTVSYHSDSSTSESSYSVNVDGDEKGGNLSISSSNSDDYYKFRAKFNASKTERVKDVLLDKLGKTNLKVSGSTYEWVSKENGNEVFECKLTSGRLRIYLDKEEVSDDFAKEIEALGKKLREEISGKETVKHREREVERAQRALERAQENLERVKRRN